MHILAEIEREHSKSQTLVIAQYIKENPSTFQELMQIFLKGEYRNAQRAAWILRECFSDQQSLLKSYFPSLLNKLYETPIHDAIKRNVMAIFADYKGTYPESIHDQLLEKAFEYLENQKEKVAIKAHSMTVIERLCQVYPELQNELKILLEDQLEFGSAGFKSRAKKILGSIK